MNQPITADAWVATALGAPATVLARQRVEVRAPGPGEIRVAVHAFCLNFNDIDIIGGRYTTLPLQPPFVPGMETVGVVESAGQGAEHLIGRRIVGIPVMAFGGYASYAIVDAATALDLPDWVSDVDGAALHYPFHLGWFALRERGRLKPGETLLVHAAAGGTGSGALVLGKALGARVIATAGSDEKVQFCKELGADHAINYRNGDWVEQVVELTYGRGVDVAFDAVGKGSTFDQALAALTVGGRFVGVGMSADAPSIGPTSFFNLTKKQVRGHLGYQNADIGTLATLVSRGRLDLTRSISEIVPLEDVAEGIAKLDRAEGNPIRILIQP